MQLAKAICTARSWVLLFSCALACTWAVRPSAAAADPGPGSDVAQLLAKPVSPGTLALLIAYVENTAVRQHWTDALTHADPTVRATAARLLYVVGVVSAVPALKDALSKESDERAAFEETQALLGLGGPSMIEAAYDAARRHAPEAFLTAVAKTRGANGSAILTRLTEFDLEPRFKEAVVSAHVRAADDLNAVAAAALTAGDVDLWRATLVVAHSRSLRVNDTHILAALESSAPAIRDLAWWHVAIQAAAKQPVPDRAREKIAAIRTIGAADRDRELAFGRELAARVLTDVAQTEDSELLARAKRHDTRFPYGMGVFSYPLYTFLTRSEREAFEAHEVLSKRDEARSKARHLSSDPSSDIRTIRTIGDFPPGYVADVLRQTGCQPGNSQQLAGVVVRYNEAGHVQELRPVATTLPPVCDKAARYISMAGVLPAPWNMKPGARELLLVSMNDAALQCLAEAPSPATKGSTKPAVRVGGDIKPPKKVQDVRPQYPPDALAAGQQGSVIIESQLTRSGCVRSAEVLKSAGTQLDIAALRAVGQWRFTPTLVRGEPVPVTLTVTVQFVTR